MLRGSKGLEKGSDRCFPRPIIPIQTTLCFSLPKPDEFLGNINAFL
jgi:hypothetical protein